MNCEDRHKNCHAECQKYIEWKRERDILSAKMRKSREQENEVILFASHQREKWARRKRG